MILLSRKSFFVPSRWWSNSVHWRKGWGSRVHMCRLKLCDKTGFIASLEVAGTNIILRDTTWAYRTQARSREIHVYVICFQESVFMFYSQVVITLRWITSQRSPRLKVKSPHTGCHIPPGESLVACTPAALLYSGRRQRRRRILSI